MISTRYLSIVCALVALTLVPTIIHSYIDTTVQDGRVTRAIPTVLAGYQGVPSGRNATWGQRRFDSGDWTERMYTSGTDSVKLSVIRSYDPKALYHHPELAVSLGPDWATSTVRRFPQRPEIPVHVLSTRTAGGPVAMYVLHYDDRFVQDPIGFQIRTAGELLFSRRKAMTLFFATDEIVPVSADVAALPSLRLLFAAIDQFLGSSTAAPHTGARAPAHQSTRAPEHPRTRAPEHPSTYLST